MSAREKDARAAMRSIIRVTCASQWHQAEGRLDYSMPTGEHIAKLANEVADAMEAERVRRVPPEVDPPGSPAAIARLSATTTNRYREERDEARAEIAKLRAVAEAAARLQRIRNGEWLGGLADQGLALDAALDAAIPGWRTK